MSLVKQSGIYVFGRTLPAAIAVGAVALYTRMIDPASFGRYALLLASSLLASSIGFSWLRASAFRIAAGKSNELEPDFAHTVGLLFIVMAAIVSALQYVFLRVSMPDAPLSSLLLAVAVTIVFAWNELNGAMLQARLSVVAWGIFNFMRAAVALVASLLLIRAGFRTDALLGGFAIGNATALIWLAMWRSGLSGRFDRALFERMIHFGWPSSATAAVAQIAPTFQRYTLVAAASAGAVGVYAVSQDFATQTMSVLIGSVSLAGIPLAFKAKDQGGLSALLRQMTDNARLIFAVAFPATVGLAVLAEPISSVLFGPQFRAGAPAIVALIGFSTLLSCLRTYYFDQAFELEFKTRPQAIIALVGTIAILVSASVLIPRFGAFGAGLAALATALITFSMSVVWGRRVIPVPIPWRSCGKTAFATAGMAAVMALFPRHGVVMLVAAAVTGFAVYVSLATVTRPRLIQARLGRHLAWLQR